MTTAKDNLEIFRALSTSSFESIRVLGELNLRSWENLAEKQMGTLGLFVDNGVRQLKLATETKELKELMEGQIKLAKQLNENLVTQGRETLEVTTGVQEEYRSWFENGINTNTSKFSEVAEKTA